MSIAYPFTAIVGQDDMKRALTIAAVDPGIGGVLVLGERSDELRSRIEALEEATDADDPKAAVISLLLETLSLAPPDTSYRVVYEAEDSATAVLRGAQKQL